MIRRREFVAAILGAAAWRSPARAQQSQRMRRVGVLISTREDDPESQARANVIRKGLADHGWTEGQNVQIDFRWIGGDEGRAKAYAAELVGLKPDAIIAISTLSLKAVRDETRTIPIVFAIVGDPVGQGFVPEMAHPGGNITGFSAFEFEIGSKWIEVAKLIAPDVKRAAFIFNPEAGLPHADKFVQSMARAAPARGVELSSIPVRDVAAIESVMAGLGSDANSALIVNPDAFTVANRKLIISLAARFRLPTIYPYRFFAVEGGLLSYGHETEESFRRATAYVDRIFKGTKPADLPIESPTKFELIINRKTAHELGLPISDKLVSLADEVVE